MKKIYMPVPIHKVVSSILIVFIRKGREINDFTAFP